MRTIAIINQKGGCGKTTSAINLAGVWAKRGVRTLLIDMDPQSHCAAGLGIPEARLDLDIGDALLSSPRSVDQSRLLWRVARGLDLAPSRMKLAGLEAARGGLADKPDKERRLSNLLAYLAPEYDVAIIDCPPSIGLLTFNALTAATTVLIPVETGYFALQGAARQVQTVESLNRRIGVETPVRLFGTLHDPSDVHSSALLDELRRQFGDRVAPVAIRRDPKLKEAAAFGRPIVDHDHESHGSTDYAMLSDWLLSLVGLPTDALHEAVASPVRVMTNTSASAEVAQRVAHAVGSAGETMRPGLHEVHAITGSSDHQQPTTVASSLEGATHAAESGQGGTGLVAMDTTQPGHSVPSQPRTSAAPVLDARPDARISRAQDVARRAQKLLRREHEPDTSVAFQPPEPTRVTLIPDPLSVREPVRTPSGVTRLFGVTSTRQGLLFVQPMSVGSDVSVAGSFNNWSPDTHRLRRNDALGVLELCVPLAPGRYTYRLVIDGRWCSDAFNPGTEVNPFGEHNSVAEVT